MGERRLALWMTVCLSGRMSQRIVLPLVTLALLAGCVDWPDVDTPKPSQDGALWPELQPSSALPGDSTDGEAEALANTSLQGRAAALRRRAAIMRSSVEDQAAFEQLRARLARP